MTMTVPSALRSMLGAPFPVSTWPGNAEGGVSGAALLRMHCRHPVQVSATIPVNGAGAQPTGLPMSAPVSVLSKKLRQGGVARSPLAETDVIVESFGRGIEDRLRLLV